MTHTYNDFQNGQIIQPNPQDEDYPTAVTSFSQWHIVIPPKSTGGVYIKPYNDFQTGSICHSQMLVSKEQFLDNPDIGPYYEHHRDCYNMDESTPHIMEELPDPNCLPKDSDPVELEGTAPEVKSAWKPEQKPKVLKSNKHKTFTEKADEKTKQRKLKNIEGSKQKEYDPELEKIPHYLRDKVTYLIDNIVDKRVKAYMQEFKNECYAELEDQKKTNQDHIAYYTKEIQKTQSEIYDPLEDVFQKGAVT